MKSIWLILTFVAVSCVLSFQAGCQQEAGPAQRPEYELGPPEAKTQPETTKAGPSIKFEKVTHDFGQIGPRTKKSGEFKFTNTGDELLTIKKVSRTCGCTPYTLSKKDYAPGESGKLKVSYHSGRRPGTVTKRLYVTTNDKKNARVPLTVKAKIVLKVDYEPERLKLLLKGENSACPEITLRSLDGQPFSINQFKSTGNCITADYDSSVKATKFVLKPEVDIEKLKSGSRGRVDIRLTHPECRMLTIFFEALPRFTVNPASIIVFNAEPQKPVERKLWILNNYDEDFQIASASSKNGIVEVLGQEELGKRYRFDLKITPPTDKGKRVFTDVFFVDIEGGERVRVNCNGFYVRRRKVSSS